MEIWRKIWAMGKPEKDHCPPLNTSRILTALMVAAKRDQKVFCENTVIPDHYTINLADRDLSELDPIRKAFTRELIDEIKQHARRKGYAFNTPDVTVIFQAHPMMKPGTIAVSSRFQPIEASTEEPTDAPRQPETTGTIRAITLAIAPGSPSAARVRLDPGAYIIGRGNHADIRVPADDRLASKNHCRITVENDTVCLIDLQSANGTTCNQIPITGPVFLEHKDQLLIGATRIEVLFE